MLGLLILDYKIWYCLWFFCQWIQFMIWFLELDISCDLFGYKYNWLFDFILKKWRRTCFWFLKIRILIRIFSMIVRLIFRLSCSGLGKINDHKYMLIWINKADSKTLIHFSRLFTSLLLYIINLLSLIICLVYLIANNQFLLN